MCSCPLLATPIFRDDSGDKVSSRAPQRAPPGCPLRSIARREELLNTRCKSDFVNLNAEDTSTQPQDRQPSRGRVTMAVGVSAAELQTENRIGRNIQEADADAPYATDDSPGPRGYTDRAAEVDAMDACIGYSGEGMAFPSSHMHAF
jgi:hypothetical protein